MLLLLHTVEAVWIKSTHPDPSFWAIYMGSQIRLQNDHFEHSGLSDLKVFDQIRFSVADNIALIVQINRFKS
jgi:hypothetical protein